jgi:AcrR family transcriptional regulator
MSRGAIRGRGRRRGRSAPARRTGEATRRAILAAAERRLVRSGPEAIRLQEIAADVGVSHPAILHHFGSREKLVEALAQHALAGLQRELVAIAENRPPAADHSLAVREARVTEMFERTAEVLVERGYARLLAWLVLSGRDLRPVVEGLFRGFPQAVHQTRVNRRRREGREPPELEQTRFGTALTMATLLGDALFGRLTRLAVGLPDDGETRRRFRAWMARVVETA